MRTSLNDIQKAEKFLSGDLPSEEALLFKARLMMDPVLRVNVSLQKKVYSLVRLYARRKLKSEVEVLHKKIFTDPDRADYCRQIEQLFCNP